MTKKTTWQIGRLFDSRWAPAPVTDRLVGLELEYENVQNVTLAEPHRAPDSPKVLTAQVWEAVRDGSLRNNGAEFVSLPIPHSTVQQAVMDLFRTMTRRWELSIRTGLHVHVDVRDFTVEELEATNTGYCLIEPALFNYVGQSREESVFCIPWYKAHSDCNRVVQSLGMKCDPQNKFFRLREPAMSKYDAVNWCPISRLGTIEFRHAANSLDPSWIGQWAAICVAVAEMGKKHTQQEILDLYKQSPDAFPQRVHRALACPNYESLMLRTGAEFLAHKTIPLDEPDPKNLKNWIRMNDRLPVVRSQEEIRRTRDWRDGLEAEPPLTRALRVRTPPPAPGETPVQRARRQFNRIQAEEAPPPPTPPFNWVITDQSADGDTEF